MTFTEWLRGHERDDSPVGDLAVDAGRVDDFPADGSRDVYRSYLRRRTGDPVILAALDEAWRLYVHEQRHSAKYTAEERRRIGAALKRRRDEAMNASVEFERRYGKTSKVYRRAVKIHQAIDALRFALDDLP